MIRRIVFAAGLVVLTGVFFVSLFYIPSVVGNRLKAVPRHAQVVYNNKNPDWFLSFFPMDGNFDGEFSKVWMSNFEMLEKRPLLVATVPLGGRGGRDTWVAVSELSGFDALLLRWRLMLFPPKEITAVRSYATWPVWQMDHSSLPAWATVRLTITEGLLICSISDDSHDIYYLLDTLDGRSASLADPRRTR